MFSAEDNDTTCPYYMAMPPTPTHRITRCWHLRRAVRSSSSGPWAPKAQSSQGLPGLAFAVCLEVDFISLFEPVIFSQAFMWLCVCVCLVAQSCLTLCNPMDCSPSGSSVHGISQARILERVAVSFSRGSSWATDWICIPCVSCIAGGFFTRWAMNLDICT